VRSLRSFPPTRRSTRHGHRVVEDEVANRTIARQDAVGPPPPRLTAHRWCRGFIDSPIAGHRSSIHPLTAEAGSRFGDSRRPPPIEPSSQDRPRSYLVATAGRSYSDSPESVVGDYLTSGRARAKIPSAEATFGLAPTALRSARSGAANGRLPRMVKAAALR